MRMVGSLQLQPVLIATVAAIVVAGFGALLTELGPWYYNLRFPVWKPPDWLFGPAWTTIFTLTAVAGVSAWSRVQTAADRRLVIALFIANGLFNILWSLLFFRLRHPDWALVEVIFLWLSILLLILKLARFSTMSSWLLVPYLAWVSYAAILNFTIVRLNAPF